MKLIIDIPKKTIAHIRSNYGHGYKGIYDEDREKIVKAIYNGKPYEPIHGEWIEDRYKGNLTGYNCSICGYSVIRKYKFCVCGADMRGE